MEIQAKKHLKNAFFFYLSSKRIESIFWEKKKNAVYFVFFNIIYIKRMSTWN